MALRSFRSPPRWLSFLLALFTACSFVAAQGCSKANPCAVGCCSQFGFCGTDEDHCGAGCVDTCDYKLGCDVLNPYASGCCNIFGFCGFGLDCKFQEACVR